MVNQRVEQSNDTWTVSASTSSSASAFKAAFDSVLSDFDRNDLTPSLRSRFGEISNLLKESEDEGKKQNKKPEYNKFLTRLYDLEQMARLLIALGKAMEVAFPCNVEAEDIIGAESSAEGLMEEEEDLRRSNRKRSRAKKKMSLWMQEE
jgi:hypothetical protein